MSNLDELIRQKEDLERQILQARSSSRTAAINQIRALMSENGLSIADLTSAAKRPSKSGSEAPKKSVAAKYKDANGNTWSGRGLKPKWLTTALQAGKSIEDFVI